MRLKILASVIVALILGYIVFWHYMAGELEKRFESWIYLQKKQGLAITYKALEITGFPYRMELSLTRLNMVRNGKNTPRLSLTSPKITLIAFPWKINHGVIVSAGGQVRWGQRRKPDLTLNFGKSRASLLIDLGQKQLRRLSIISNDISWRASQKKKPSVARELKLHILRPDNSSGDQNEMELPAQVKFYLEARDIIARDLPPDSPTGIFGKKADRIRLDLTLHGKTLPQYNRDSLISWRDNGGTLALKMLDITSGKDTTSGKITLTLAGESSLDQDLKPLGAFSAKIHGIGHIISILSNHSAFQEKPGSLILEEITQMSQEKDRLDLAISLQAGMLFLGPIPLYELKPVVE